MTNTPFSLFVATILSLSIVSNSSSAATVTESGSDAFYFSGWDFTPTPDLVSASATFDASYLYLSVRITPGFPAIDPSTHKGNTAIAFYLDTDQNPATGRGYCSGSCDAGILGYEKEVYFDTLFPTAARVYDNTFAFIGSFPSTLQPDGFDTKIPLASLGDDGLLNFKVLEDVQLSLSSTTVIMDVLPDMGLAAGTSSPVPEPTAITLMLAGCSFAVVGSSRSPRRRLECE